VRAESATFGQPRAESRSVSGETAPWVAYFPTHLRPVRATIRASMVCSFIVALTGRRLLYAVITRGVAPGWRTTAPSGRIVCGQTVVGAYLRDAPLNLLQSPFALAKGAPRRFAPTTITLAYCAKRDANMQSPPRRGGLGGAPVRLLPNTKKVGAEPRSAPTCDLLIMCLRGIYLTITL
jgi:hypothetical protein